MLPDFGSTLRLFLRLADALREALPFLLTSERDFKTLEITDALMDVQYLLSVFYHTLGMTAERDEAVSRHFSTVENKPRPAVEEEKEAKQVWRVVSQVGAALARR